MDMAERHAVRQSRLAQLSDVATLGFDELAERAVLLGLRTQAQVDLLTDAIASGERTEANAEEELRGLKSVDTLGAAQTARNTTSRQLSRLDGIGEGHMAFQASLMDQMLRVAGVPNQREWLPSELGSIESDWEGLPARELFLALRDGRIDELSQLLDADASRVDDQDSASLGLLHHVGFDPTWDAAAVDVIVQHGGSTELRSKHDETPLILAACYLNLPAAERLLRHGARVDATDCHGHTALYRAEETGPRSARSVYGGTSRVGSSADGEKLVALLRAEAERQRKDVGSGGRFRATEAEAHRRRGNEAFARGAWQEAIDAYSASLRAHEDARTYANRAACWLKLGHARYVERRATHGLFHQICDGEAKVVRWCPASYGRTESSDYWPFCSGMCASTCDNRAAEYKCRTVEVCTSSVAQFYRSAVEDAGKAKSLDPTNAKAHFRQARANVGLRDFPRAVMCLREGLRHCPDSEALQTLLRKIEDLSNGEDLDRISNPFAPGHAEMLRRGSEALANASAMIMCAFCTTTIAHDRPVCDGLEEAALAGLGRRPPFAYKRAKPKTKEKALRAAGFPVRCPHCACNPCADIDQKAIRDLIDE